MLPSRYDRGVRIVCSHRSYVLTWGFLRKCDKLAGYLSRGTVDDEADSQPSPTDDYHAKVFLTAHVTAVFPERFFAQPLSGLSQDLLTASRYAADAFDRVASAVRSKSSLFIEDLERLCSAERDHRAAFEAWRDESKQSVIAKSQFALSHFYPSMRDVPYEVLVSANPNIESLSASAARFIYVVYGAASVDGVVHLIRVARDDYNAKRAAPQQAPLGPSGDLIAAADLLFQNAEQSAAQGSRFSGSDFSIDAIVERATPSAHEEGIFHLELGQDEPDHPMPPRGSQDFDTLTKTVAGGLITCYANTTIPTAPDTFSVMVLMNLVRNLKKYPSLMPWAREYYDKIRSDHIAACGASS